MTLIFMILKLRPHPKSALYVWTQSECFILVRDVYKRQLYICIFIVIYGRMIEIYLVTSVAPLPMAAMMGKEWGGMGQNYLCLLYTS